MEQEIRVLLRAFGPCLTSDLIAKMVEDGISAAAARKRIQRVFESFDIQRLAGLRFEKNARFIYLSEQYGTPLFWQNLETACLRAGRSYWSTIIRLKARGGIVSLENFPLVAGTPEARTRQLSPDRIRERLQAVNVLETFEDNGILYVRFRPRLYPRVRLSSVRADEMAENIALEGVKDWARRIGFGSFGKFAIRGDKVPPSVSGIRWDLSAPNYMRPIVSVANGIVKPGFFVCDINLHGVIEVDEATAFIRKCDLASAPLKVPPIMPMLVGHVFSADALQALKSKGILAVSLQNIFSLELSDALKSLVIMLTDMGARAAAEPEHIRKVMDTLTKIEGSAENLRGALFELVIGSLVKDVEEGYLTTGERRTDPNTGRKVEIDVRLTRKEAQEILFVECKSKKPGARVSEEDVKKWYEDRVPLIHSIFSHYKYEQSKNHRFELWTNGSFAASALAWFRAQPNEFEGYSVGLIDGEELKKYARGAKNASLRDTLNEHYFRSPMQKVIE